MNDNQQNQQQPYWQVNCDKCSQSIPIDGREKTRWISKYENGIITHNECRLLCGSCGVGIRGSGLYPELGAKYSPQATWVKTPNVEKYEAKLKGPWPLNKEGLTKMLEDDWQERLKKGGKIW